MPNPYIANTDADRRAMLEAVGLPSVDALFADIPAAYRDPRLDLPPALSEPELLCQLEELAARNRPAGQFACFLGGGAYRHFCPSLVESIVGRGEFATAYTPYQPEVSQGTLQTTFEFQSLVCELYAMDVANAGMYEGASALAEACLMAAAITGRSRIALLDTVNRRYADTVRTYAAGRGLAVDEFPPDDVQLTAEHACLAIQQPNFFGYLEEVDTLERTAHGAGALYVVAADPLSLGLLKPPGEYRADIAVGEGQALGVPLSFGGPYVGLFTVRQDYVRQMPGRIVGRTTDREGRTGYVLTLQTREQHIRRERATSNICTSQQLVGLWVTVYLCTLGKQGLRRIAQLCYHKSHYAAERIAILPGYSLALEGTFFQEFVVRCPKPVPEINERLLEKGIVGGLDVSDRVENGMLVCVTEMNTREEIERLVEGLGSVNG